jgi:hypothetical protein
MEKLGKCNSNLASTILKQLAKMARQEEKTFPTLYFCLQYFILRYSFIILSYTLVLDFYNITE